MRRFDRPARESQAPRWRWCVVALVAMALLAPSAPAADEISPDLEVAVARGLAYLSQSQNPDGSLDGGGPKLAITGLTVMAMLAVGQVPDQGHFGAGARNAVDFLVRQVPEDGYAGRVDGSRMYGQGIVTLALAEASGVESDPGRQRRLRLALTRLVGVILRAQDLPKPEQYTGGWRYEPQSADSDLSLSGWNALALRAARSIGLAVPADRATRASAFVLKCYQPRDQGFTYQPGSAAAVGMTGVGLLDLYLLDSADRPEVAAAAGYLTAHPINDTTPMPYYATYFVTQAAYQAGGTTWATLWPAAKSRLIGMQNSQDGGWPQSRSPEEPGRVYATSMAVLALAVPYRLLPVYQR